MAYACDYCGKTVDHGHKVSHAKNRTKTLRKPNLHRAKVLEGGKKVQRRLCTKCLRKAERPHKQELVDSSGKSGEQAVAA